MKKLYIFFLLFMLAVTSASAEVFTLGSCDHKIAGGQGQGSDKAGEISAAMFVPASRLKTLAGNCISRVDVGLISRINVRDITVWVRHDLLGENLASAFVERGSVGWNEVKLDSPYLIEENCPGLYIGFTYVNTGSSHPLSFIGDPSDYTFWFRSEADGKWQDMTQKGALSMEVIVTGDKLPLYDLALLSSEISPDLSAGENVYSVSGKVSNLALRAVTGFNVSVKKDGTVVGESDVKTEVLPGTNTSFFATVKASEALSGDVEIEIASLFDGADVDMSNNSVDSRVAFRRNVLFEEFTTESCSNCPEAANMIHELFETDPIYTERVASVCHHSGFGRDWLTRSCDDDLVWFYDMNGTGFAPAAMFDRQPLFRRGLNMDREEPIVALRSEKDVEECIAIAMAVPAHAMLGLKVGEEYGETDARQIDVEVSILTDSEFALNSPCLTFYAVENNIVAHQQQGASGNYIHQHVIRYDNGGWGEPIDIKADGSLSKTFTVNLEPEWKRDDMYFVAFVAERNPDDVKGNMVENTAFASLVAKAPVSVASFSSDVVEIARYDLLGNRVSAENKGLTIVVFSDGSVKKVFNK